jgi:hypothetical protein
MHRRVARVAGSFASLVPPRTAWRRQRSAWLGMVAAGRKGWRMTNWW